MAKRAVLLRHWDDTSRMFSSAAPPWTFEQSGLPFIPYFCNESMYAEVFQEVQHITAQHSTAQHSTAQHSTAQHSTAQHSTAQHSMAERLASYSKQAYPRRGYLGGLPGTALERHLVYWHCLPHQPMCEHLILHPLHNNTQPCVHTQNAAH